MRADNIFVTVVSQCVMYAGCAVFFWLVSVLVLPLANFPFPTVDGWECFFAWYTVINESIFCVPKQQITPQRIPVFLKHICALELVQQILAFPVSDKFIVIVYSEVCFSPFLCLLIGKSVFSESFFYIKSSLLAASHFYLSPSSSLGIWSFS